MGKVTDSFFDEKKAWSIAKDDLLKHYLNAYMVKLFYTHKPTIYLDCFAGAGKFGDDDVPFEEKVDGSPLIALSAIQHALKKSTVFKPIHLACFIEPVYNEQLETNIKLANYSQNDYLIYNGAFPGEIQSFLADIFKYWENPNLFCYLDPFGVKYLKFNTFKQIKERNFYSVEFLINFNSFGLFRYACAAWKTDIREDEIANAGEITEREPMDETGNGDNFARIDEVMGTNRWRLIIDNYKHSKIDGYEAESELAGLYKIQLKQVLCFKYVLSIPIRFKDSNHPKYRMIYATNHEDGAVIMGGVMRGRQDYLYEQYTMSKNGGCFDLFDREDLLDRPSVEESVIDFLKGKGELSGNEFFAGFYDEKFLTANLLEVLQKLEDCNRITIRREPSITEKKKPSKFYTESKGKHLFINLNG